MVEDHGAGVAAVLVVKGCRRRVRRALLTTKDLFAQKHAKTIPYHRRTPAPL